ncbi:DUF202 domain-containing protein [Nocardia sp. NPDC059764]|uniref:DUF202 domain-containing protein n=1 Tax=Nocardia sp. NPDC059764 TaxID=3346939 RepID=UPI0036561556
MTEAPTYYSERTALAWRRTAIAAMGTSGLFVNHAVVSGWRPAAIGPALAAVGLLFLAGISFARNNSLHHGHRAHGPRAIAMATVVVLIVCVVSVFIALFIPGAPPATT